MVSRILVFTKAATAVTFHNLAYAPGANKVGIGLKVKKQIASWLYPRGFDGPIGISKAVAEHYETALGLHNVQVVHNPVDLESIDRMGLDHRGNTNDPIRIVLPGRIVHEKGHHDLLQGLQILRDRNSEFQVIFAGDGPLRDSVEEELRKLGLVDYVKITGVLQHDQMLKTIAEADIVVVPSRFEGFGLTAIEAMALSKPVIATKVGGLTDIVLPGETGMLVPAKDPEALAEALSTLMADGVLRERLGRAGRERVESHFSLPAITDQLIDVYKGIDRAH